MAKKAIDQKVLVEALKDYIDNRAYAGGGNYRYASTGKITSWNKLAKRVFHSVNHFYNDAKSYKETGVVVISPYVVHENVRITSYANRIIVEMAHYRQRDGIKYNFDSSTNLHGFAARAAYEAVKKISKNPMFNRNIEIDNE